MIEDDEPTVSTREIALDYAIRLAMNIGVSDTSQIVAQAESFRGFLDGDTTTDLRVTDKHLTAVPIFKGGTDDD